MQGCIKECNLNPLPIAAKKTCMPPAFYDLCLSEMMLETHTRRERVLAAMKLGFGGAACVHQAGSSLSDRDKCTMPPIDSEALEAAHSSLKVALRKMFSISRKKLATPENFQQLTRINIPGSDPEALQKACSSHHIVSSYDLIAVQPQSERAFALACTSLDTDIISLDLPHRMPFKLKPSLIQSALQQGICFEICYAPSLRESNARRQLIANAQALCWETRGKNIILSSSARTTSELRGPYDVINLGTFLGMNEYQARCAVSANALAVIEHAFRRQSALGMTRVIIQTGSEGKKHTSESSVNTTGKKRIRE